MLRDDPDDMMQKGVGWILKEAYPKKPREVVEFLDDWRGTGSGCLQSNIGCDHSLALNFREHFRYGSARQWVAQIGRDDR